MTEDFIKSGIESVIKDTVDNYSYNIGEVLELAKELEMEFTFEELKHILKIEPLEMAV